MPEHKFSSKKLRGHIRTVVTLRREEVISLCRCWQSNNFPLCDGSHKYNTDDKGPVIIHADCESDFRN
jgi:CDGSH-type Zn-finger protein